MFICFVVLKEEKIRKKDEFRGIPLGFRPGSKRWSCDGAGGGGFSAAPGLQPAPGPGPGRFAAFLTCTFWRDGNGITNTFVRRVPILPFAVLDDLNQEKQRDSSLGREVSDKMVCLACRCTFNHREDQVFQGFVFNPFRNAMHGSWHRHLGPNYFLWYVRWNTTSSTGIVSIWSKRFWELRRSQPESLRRRLERVRKSRLLAGKRQKAVWDVKAVVWFPCF